LDYHFLPSLTEQSLRPRFNTLGKEIRRTLEELRKALKGLVVMSESLESMFIALGNNMVPGLWARVSYLSLKPLGAWKDDYIRRMAFFKKWSHTGLPTCFWISGFFFPQGFLTGALQNHARRYKCAVDTLSFGFTMRVMESAEDVTAANVPDDGVLVDGMFLEGARWDRKQKKLRLGYPGQLLSPVPVIHFRPMEDYTLPQEDYHCPLYKTNERAGVLSTTGQSTNFIREAACRSLKMLVSFVDFSSAADAFPPLILLAQVSALLETLIIPAVHSSFLGRSQ